MNKKLIIFLFSASGALSYFFPLGTLYMGTNRRGAPLSLHIYEVGWTAIIGVLCFAIIGVMVLVNLLSGRKELKPFKVYMGLASTNLLMIFYFFYMYISQIMGKAFIDPEYGLFLYMGSAIMLFFLILSSKYLKKEEHPSLESNILDDDF